MWHKFEKIDDDGTLPEIIESKTYFIRCGHIKLYNGGTAAVPMIGVLPSGRIVDDFKAPECEPYFIITFKKNDSLTFGIGGRERDIITDGEKYAWIHNRTKDSACHFVGEECVLAETPDGVRILTTRDARIIKALIKVHLEELNVE